MLAVEHVNRAIASRLKKLPLAAALLAGLYLAGANLFLNTALGPWAVNRRPQTVRVTWQRAWTILPGDIRVRGLRIEGHTAAVDWWITAERGQGWIDLPGLFVRRFRVRGFTGEGVRSATVRREIAFRRARRPPPPHPWRIEMPGAVLTAVREIGWNGFRLEGEGTARGGFSLLVGGDFSLETTQLRMPGARLLLAAEQVASLDVQAEAAIAPYTPRQHPGVAGWDFLSGTLRARGTATPGDLLMDLMIDLRLDHGRLVPGSQATLRGGNPASHPLAALLTVETRPAGPQLVLRADARGFTAGHRADPSQPPPFAAETVHLEAVTPETRFSRLLAQGQTLRHTGSLPADGVLRATFGATGLRLAGSGPRLTWQLTADHGGGQIDLAALFRRQILLDQVQVDGITAKAEKTRTPRPERPAGQGVWTVHLAGARLTGIREAAFDDLRLDGSLEVGGDLALDPDGSFALDGLAVRLAAGRLHRGAETLASGLTMTTDLRLGRTSQLLQTGLDGLSGSVTAGGTLTSVPFLAASGAGRSGNFSRFRLDLHLDRGRLVPGTRLAVTAGKPLRIDASVETAKAGQPPRLVLSGEAKGLALGGGGAGANPPLLRAGTAILRTVTPELELRRLLATAEELKAGEPAAGEPLTGDLEIEGMQAVGVGERIVWQLAADRASARLNLPALLERRAVLSGLRITGAVAEIDTATGPPPVVPPEKRWAVEIRDARIDDLRSIAIPAGRLIGPGHLEGDLTVDRARVLTVPRALLTMSAGRIESRRNPVARGVTVRADLRLSPFEPAKVHGLALLRTLSGDIAVQGQVSSLGFLDRYLERVPSVEVDGEGRLDADVRLAAGELLPGSRFDVRGGKVRATFLNSVADGEATVAGTVAGGAQPIATVRVDFSTFAIAPQPADSDPEPPSTYMRGAGLRLGITSNDLDLATPVSNLHAAIDLPDGQIPDLTVYNTYLPPGTGIAILSGTGRLRLHFDIDATGRTGNGEVLLTSDTAQVRFQELELAGNLMLRLMLRAELTGKSLKTQTFQIAGTRLDFDRVTYREIGAAPGTESPGWWSHLRMTDGTMTWGRPLTLQGAATLEMKNSGFLLSVFDPKKKILHGFRHLLSIEGVHAEGIVRCGDGAIEISPLRVTGGRFDLRSRLRFSKDSKQGDLYLRWGKLAAGIELRDGKRTFKLRHPEAWFESGKEPE
ncbi:MAG TPA: hypothetical protein VH988_30415 [Thermoanaerobaculia bacterium]|nr:hypothetical protein [Thermoanaerobaculia bacterium]